MKAATLIAQFKERTHLPVDVNDVVLVLQQNGIQDDIEFIGVDLDPRILQGQIKVFHKTVAVYGEPIRCANIYYHRGHGIDWQRMICCKELIHILDPKAAESKTPDELNALAESVGLPPELQNPRSDGFAANVDRVAEYRAAAILLPWAAREILMPFLKRGDVTIDDIARLADIPRKYVSAVMNEVWETIHPVLCGD